MDAETAQATPKANHAFKRARKDDGVDLANSNRPSKRTKKEAIVEPPKRVQKESLDTTKPSAVFKPKKGRDWTLSLALPGSFIAKYVKTHPEHLRATLNDTKIRHSIRLF